MLDDRTSFLALADGGSFARAARQLGVARSTIMRRLDALEAQLGLSLVQRAGRQVVLTDAGRRYAEALRPVLRELGRVEQRLRADQGEIGGELRVWLPILGTGIILIPATAAFRAACPDVVVHLELGRDVRRLDMDRFDVAMQTSHRINRDLASRTIGRARMILVAGRGYLERHGAPETVDDLSRHVAVHELGVEGRLRRWRWPDGRRAPMPPPAIVVNSAGHAYDFARLGCGIVRTSDLLAAPDLARGEVVQVLPEIYSEEPITIVYLPDPTPTVRHFVDFVVDYSRAAAERRLAVASPAAHRPERPLTAG